MLTCLSAIHLARPEWSSSIHLTIWFNTCNTITIYPVCPPHILLLNRLVKHPEQPIEARTASFCLTHVEHHSLALASPWASSCQWIACCINTSEYYLLVTEINLACLCLHTPLSSNSIPSRSHCVTPVIICYLTYRHTYRTRPVNPLVRSYHLFSSHRFFLLTLSTEYETTNWQMALRTSQTVIGSGLFLIALSHRW